MPLAGLRQAIGERNWARLIAPVLLLACSSIAVGCGGMPDAEGDAGTWVVGGGTDGGEFVSSPTHRYRVVRSADSVPAPSPGPKSFTFDGHDYWFLYGGETKSGARVVELDPGTSTVLRDWVVPPLLIDSPDALFGGIAWDGEAVWVGTSGVGAAVFRITANGLAEKGWKVQREVAPTELAFDGTRLWVSTSLGTGGSIDAISLVDGRPQVSFLVQKRPRGVAARTGEVWVAALLGGLDVYDPVNGVLFNPVTSKDGVPEQEFRLGSIAFVGRRLGSLQESRVVLYDIEAWR